MNLSIRTWPSVLCGAMVMCCFALPASAETALPPVGSSLFELSLEELLDIRITSASRREQPLREIPASVTVVTRAEIEAQGYATLADLLRNLPGLYLLDNTEDLFLGTRGTVGGGIQFLRNGVPQHPSLQKTLTATEIAQTNIPIEAIDRLEFLRGPMSVIYGNNAFSGVINIVTNDLDQNGPRQSVTVGTKGGERLFARATLNGADGYLVVNAGVERTDGLSGRYTAMEPSTPPLAPGAHDSMEGHAAHDHRNLDLSAGLGGLTANLRLSEMDFGLYTLSPGFGEGSRADLRTLHGSLAYERRLSGSVVLRATGILSTENYINPTFDLLLPTTEGRQSQTSRRTDFEVNLFLDPTERLQVLSGVRYRLVDEIDNHACLTLDPSDPGSTLVDIRRKMGDYATQDLFGQATWRPAVDWQFVAGLRLTLQPETYERTDEDRITDTTTTESSSPGDRRLLTGRLAAIYNPVPGHIVKFLLGSGAQDSDAFQHPEAETISSAEVNHVATGEGWQVSTSLFRNRTENIVRAIHVLEDGVYVRSTDNSGSWTTLGLETAAEVRPSPRWRLAANLAWQATEDNTYDIEVGYSPHLLAGVHADVLAGPWTFGLGGHFVGPMKSDWDFVEGPTEGVTERLGEDVDGYWNLNANARYRVPGGIYAQLNVSNLLDTEFRYPANEVADFTRGMIGMGRVVSATLGWEFR